MRRFTFGIVIVLLFSVAGCEKTESPMINMPGFYDPPSIDLRFEQDTVFGNYNTLHSQEIIAICLNSDGSAVPDLKVEFSIINLEDWKGQVSIPDTCVTDERGEVRPTYSVNLQRSGRVSIKAQSGLSSGTGRIELVIVE